MHRFAPFALLLSTSALAVPLELAHQGRVLDSTGAPLDGTHPLTVSLYADPSGGTALWTETRDIDFDDGFFSVRLGADPSNPLLPDDLGDGLFVAVAVDGNPEMTRIATSSVPYALVAHGVSGGTVEATGISVGGQEVVAADGTVPWSRLAAVPAELADGDDDTLAALSCAEGQVARFDGAWTCGSVAWSEVSGTPDVFDGAGGLDAASVSVNGTRIVDGDGTVSATALRVGGQEVVASDGTLAWSRLSAVPPELADGDDDTLGALTCAYNQVPKWIGGEWVCGGDILLDEAAVEEMVTDEPLALQGTLNGLKMAAGFRHFEHKSCGETVGDPCVIPLAGFDDSPFCTISMRRSDATDYRESMVIKRITPTALEIWRGDHTEVDTTMSVYWTCMGS